MYNKRVIGNAICFFVIFTCAIDTSMPKDLQQALCLLKSKLLMLAQSLSQEEMSKDPVNISEDNIFRATFFDSKQLQMKRCLVYWHYDQIPLIGFYDAFYTYAGFNFLIEVPSSYLTAKNFVKNVPEKILNEIKGIETVHFHVVGTDPIFEKNVIKKVLNIVYHGFVSVDYDITKDFKCDVLMGIFNPDGVEDRITSPISIGSLRAEDVHFHDEDCISPNNACIKIKEGREVSTFWSLAISPNKQRATVVYHLLLNTEEIQKKFFEICKYRDNFTTSQLLKDMLQVMLNNKEDKNAIQAFVTIVKKLLYVKVE